MIETIKTHLDGKKVAVKKTMDNDLEGTMYNERVTEISTLLGNCSCQVEISVTTVIRERSVTTVIRSVEVAETIFPSRPQGG